MDQLNVREFLSETAFGTVNGKAQTDLVATDEIRLNVTEH